MDRPELPAAAPAGGSPRAGYLTFALGRREYAINILCVQEIRNCEQITRVSGAPPFVLGVTNLRGNIVPVVDMRIRFGTADVTAPGSSVAVVLGIGGRATAIVVDGVSDVVDLAGGDIAPAPDLSDVIDRSFISGLGTVGERMLIIIDIEKLIASPDMGLAAGDDA